MRRTSFLWEIPNSAPHAGHCPIQREINARPIQDHRQFLQAQAVGDRLCHRRLFTVKRRHSATGKELHGGDKLATSHCKHIKVGTE